MVQIYLHPVSFLSEKVTYFQQNFSILGENTLKMNFLGKLELVEMETIEQLVQSAGKAFQNVLNIWELTLLFIVKFHFHQKFI